MSLLPNPKTLTLPETPHHHYTYHHTPPTNPSLPTLLFLHGFPSSAYDFRHQITHLSSQGYGILAPDLLGYNGTSQPLDVTAYSMPKMAHEIIQLLNHENLDTVVGISHDWGSALLSTLLRHYAERFRAFVFIATYYAAAHPYSTDREFNYEKLRDDTVPKFGFNAFGHVAFLGQAEKAGKVLDTDDGVESFFDLTYAREQGLWREVFRKEGGIEAWVGEGRRTEVAAWIGGEEERRKIIESWKMGNGFVPKCMWYKQLLHGVSLADEDEQDDGKVKSKLKQPILLMIEQRDVPGRGESAESAAREVSENVFVENCDTGHWVMLEDVEGTNTKLDRFLQRLPEGGGYCY